MIRMGLCTPATNAPLAASLGFDYVEAAVSQVVAMDEAAFEEAVAAVNASGLRVEAFNLLLPGDMPVVGDAAAGEAALRTYLAQAIRRMRRLGGEIVVFGSGRSRRCPEGFPAERAQAQLGAFLRLLDDAFDGSGITVVIEPLNGRECNQVNLVSQAVCLARDLGLRNVAVLGDVYHMLLEGESLDALADAGGLLRHLHVAEPVRRAFPSPGDGVDYAGLIARLRQAGYAGRISIEGNTDDLAGDAPIALQTLRTAYAQAGMARIKRLRARMNDVIQATPDAAEIPYYNGHLYGVSTCAMLLARRRGLDAELAAAMGLLHDISSATYGYTEDHGPRGAEMARALLDGFSMEETELICDAIAHHSQKDCVHGLYAELLKDADTLSPWLDMPAPMEEANPARRARLASIAAELGRNA